MIYNFDHITLPSNGSKVFFGAANTGNGFFNGLKNITASYNKRILIKGGPGTGKSSLMKRFSELARKRGLEPEIILCSSDPDSLDGVLINEISLAVVDATAPHSIEPEIPGVTDIIFDPLLYCNQSVLAKNDEVLKRLTYEKRKAYGLAYEMLKSAANIRSAIYSLTKEACDKDKISSLAEAICRNTAVENHVEHIQRFDGSISAKGYTVVETFRCFKGDHTVIRDSLNTSHLLLSEIVHVLNEKNLSYIRSPDPLAPSLTSALHIPSANMTVTVNSAVKNAKIISTRRYTSNEKYALIRNDIRPLIKEFKNIMNGAFYYLRKASEAHSSIEKIYISSMDFASMQTAADNFFTKLI